MSIRDPLNRDRRPPYIPPSTIHHHEYPRPECDHRWAEVGIHINLVEVQCVRCCTTRRMEKPVFAIAKKVTEMWMESMSKPIASGNPDR